jgi:hypothetical protein
MTRNQIPYPKIYHTHIRCTMYLINYFFNEFKKLNLLIYIELDSERIETIKIKKTHDPEAD